MTEIRVCQCGKAAGHPTVCRQTGTPAGLTDDDVERVDPAFEAQRAERRRTRFEKRAGEFAAERRNKRAGMSLTELLLSAMERAVKLSTVPAGSTEPSRSGSSDGSAPPRQATLDDDPRWREHEAVIRRRLGYMHELLDEAEGLGAVANPTLTADEKDARIRHHSMEGKTALQVYDELGPYVAGSPETVRRVRRAKSLDAHGYPREPKPPGGSIGGSI